MSPGNLVSLWSNCGWKRLNSVWLSFHNTVFGVKSNRYWRRYWVSEKAVQLRTIYTASLQWCWSWRWIRQVKSRVRGLESMYQQTTRGSHRQTTELQAWNITWSTAPETNGIRYCTDLRNQSPRVRQVPWCHILIVVRNLSAILYYKRQSIDFPFNCFASHVKTLDYWRMKSLINTVKILACFILTIT